MTTPTVARVAPAACACCLALLDRDGKTVALVGRGHAAQALARDLEALEA